MRIVHLLIGGLLLVALAVYAVHQQVRLNDLRYDLHDTEQEAATLREQNRALAERITAKEDSRVLRKRAEELELQIVPPEDAVDAGR